MKRIIVFGYGAVGREIARLLAARGDDVTVAQRSEPKALPANVRFVRADLMDSASVAAEGRGREVVVAAPGFPYDAKVWARVWPASMRALLDASAGAGARFIFADNLYMYGPQTEPLRDDMPLTNYGKKPRIRAEITRMWQADHAAGRVRATAVRASDFFGPDVPNSELGAYGIGALIAGKPALVIGDVDVPHDMTYVPDIAKAVAALVDAPDDAYGRAWHVPNAPARTKRQLLEAAAALAGVPLRMQCLPLWALPFVGLIQPQVREFVEMNFQRDRPYLVDASAFVGRFGDVATPWETSLAETVAYYKAEVAAS